MYTVNDVDKIVEYKTWSVTRKVDALLYLDCQLYTNLGTDSTKRERDDVRKTSRTIYRSIKKLNPALGKLFLQAMDTEIEGEILIPHANKSTR